MATDDELTEEVRAASDALINAFEAAAAGVDLNTIRITIGRLAFRYVDDAGRDVLRREWLNRLEETEDGAD